MARGEVANPFDPQGRKIKRISQKKNKSDEDYELLAQLQFQASLYYDERIGPYIPIDNIWKCLQQAAARYKEAAQVKSLVVIKGLVGKDEDSGAAKLIYNGPRELQALYADKRFVFLKMGKIPGKRTSILTARARFDQWAVEFVIEYLEISKERLMDYNAVAGRLIGVGAWRPQHGLFVPEAIK
jgi:hypothetical protein